MIILIALGWILGILLLYSGVYLVTCGIREWDWDFIGNGLVSIYMSILLGYVLLML